MIAGPSERARTLQRLGAGRRGSRPWSRRRRRGGPTDRPGPSRPGATRPDAERTRDVGRAVGPIKVELGDRRPLPREQRGVPEPELASGRTRRSAPPGRSRACGSVRVDRHMRDEVGADADPSPATRDGRPERVAEPLLPAVLDGVERGADRAAERGAPVELEERRRQVARQPDRDARGCSRRAIQRRAACRAERRPLAAATDAGGGRAASRAGFAARRTRCDHAHDDARCHGAGAVAPARSDRGATQPPGAAPARRGPR